MVKEFGKTSKGIFVDTELATVKVKVTGVLKELGENFNVGLFSDTEPAIFIELGTRVDGGKTFPDILYMTSQIKVTGIVKGSGKNSATVANFGTGVIGGSAFLFVF